MDGRRVGVVSGLRQLLSLSFSRLGQAELTPAWLCGPILGEASPPPTHPAGVERGMWSSQQPGPADCHSSVSWASAGPHMHIGRVKSLFCELHLCAQSEVARDERRQWV